MRQGYGTPSRLDDLLQDNQCALSDRSTDVLRISCSGNSDQELLKFSAVFFFFKKVVAVRRWLFWSALPFLGSLK